MTGQIDSWTVERDGIRYRIDLDPDYDANADARGQGDCYSPSDLAAHARGEWEFVGVTVTAEVPGTDYADSYPVGRASLWRVEFGNMPAETEPWEGGQHEEIRIDRAELERYPLPDLIMEVRGELRGTRDRLAGLQLDDCPATHLRTDGIPQPAKVYCERAAGHDGPHRVMDYTWTEPVELHSWESTLPGFHCECGKDLPTEEELENHVAKYGRMPTDD